jgi:lycopene beta-cyclase
LSSCKQSIKLTSFLKTEKTFLDFYSKRRFKLYDAIFLEVLHQHNELGSDIFNMLFERNAIQPIFKFLDDESTLIEEFNIINSLPKMIFIKALSRVIWKGL